MKPEQWEIIMDSHIQVYYEVHKRKKYTAITIFGLQDDGLTFAYGNCCFNVQTGYDDLGDLTEHGFIFDRKIYQMASRNAFLVCGTPAIAKNFNWNQRQQLLHDFLCATYEFHENNTTTVLWAHGAVWASLFFTEWIRYDKSFPIIYLVSSLAGVGKTTTFYALAASVGLEARAIGGNKTSEAGMLDWINTHRNIAFFLDDFNAQSEKGNKDKDNWKHLFKQIYDGKSVMQNQKCRNVYSSVLVTSNMELCPEDIPVGQRLLSLYFKQIKTSQNKAQAETKYKTISDQLSMLVPDVLKMRHKGKLDMKYIGELHQYIVELSNNTCPPRVAHNLKKPMYFLLLMLSLADVTTDCYDEFIFEKLSQDVEVANTTVTQTPVWTKFFYWFSQTMNSCNKLSSNPQTSIHWWVQIVCYHQQ